MKHRPILLLIPPLLLLLSGCSQKLEHFPKKPDFSIHKPRVIYKPTKKNLDKMVKQLQGMPYVWAEEGPRKFDCSGFVYYMYGSMGIEVPRVARNQAKEGRRISVSQLQYGDLIFFATNKHNHKKITHVGVYLGNGWFTHASTSKYEVTYSNLFQSKYYTSRLRACRRYLPESFYQTSYQTTWERGESLLQPQPSTKKANTTSSKHKAVILPAQSYANQESLYYIQVGSFVGEPKKSLLEKIQHKHLPLKKIRFQQNNQPITKLLIGPYRSKEEAKKLLLPIQEEIQPHAFLAKIEL